MATLYIAWQILLFVAKCFILAIAVIFVFGTIDDLISHKSKIRKLEKRVKKLEEFAGAWGGY